jgi:lipoprotein-anchoring transpeptidase ErfK/SrfK
MNRRQFSRLVSSTFLAMLPGVPVARAMVHLQEPFTISWQAVNKVPRRFRRRVVAYSSSEPPGTIVIDTASRYLYLVRPGNKAVRYGIGVGRQGFSWSGRATIRWKAKWPRWTPPAAMVARDAFAAKWADGMPGGPTNPLGARALYLFQGNIDTLYRIHGTFQPESIGKAVSSGCIRLLNIDIADLYERVPIGTQVIVIQRGQRPALAREESRPKIKPVPVVRQNFNLIR